MFMNLNWIILLSCGFKMFEVDSSGISFLNNVFEIASDTTSYAFSSVV